jgi:hypothetical protein
VNTINKRFDDLYVLGGIIIILLLAINAGIFVRADMRTKKFFTKNFKIYEKEINKIVSDSQILLEKQKAQLEINKQVEKYLDQKKQQDGDDTKKS